MKVGDGHDGPSEAHILGKFIFPSIARSTVINFVLIYEETTCRNSLPTSIAVRGIASFHLLMSRSPPSQPTHFPVALLLFPGPSTLDCNPTMQCTAHTVEAQFGVNPSTRCAIACSLSAAAAAFAFAAVAIVVDVVAFVNEVNCRSSNFKLQTTTQNSACKVRLVSMLPS